LPEQQSFPELAQEQQTSTSNEPSTVADPSSELGVPESDKALTDSMRAQAENLHKLCKVWGFVKYTHLAFLTGEKNWDEELLGMIPLIRFAEEDEVNDILYDWYVSLGDDGYDGHGSSYQTQDLRCMVDLTWITDESYLGAPLSAALARFREIPKMDLSKAPVFFDDNGVCDFSNEKAHSASGVENYLLGLFRLWNAIEYYFPYKDIIDYDWNEVLLEFIPEMIEAANADSYWFTLYAVSAKTHDAHVYWDNQPSKLEMRFGGSYTGDHDSRRLAIPVMFERAEGQIVVLKTFRDIFLQPGDVVISVDGVDINKIVEDIKQYIAVPNDEKLRDVMLFLPLCKSSMPEVTVLRDGKELTDTVRAVSWDYKIFKGGLVEKPIEKSHELLDNNIGLINPMIINADQLYDVMKEFSGTDGLIIDLRQRPHTSISVYLLAEYFLDEVKPCTLWSKPFAPVPGFYWDASISRVGPGVRVSREWYAANDIKYPDVIDPYFYNKPVVILMNQHSQSKTEAVIMGLRTGPNVTVLGSNSIGADGNCAYLPMPGGATLRFTNFGAYTPEGGQTQRIGLSPDIYIEQTIAGIRDGRDELMEAAVEFLLGQ
jgi:hypothetical protein